MIDTHIHFWRYRAEDYPWISDAMPQLKQDRLPEHIAPQAQAAGIGGAVAVQARCSEAENDFLLALAAQDQWIRGVVGWLDLRSDSLNAALERLSGETLMKGFRHIVQDEPKPSEYWADSRFGNGVKRLQQNGYVYDLLCHQRDLAAVVAFSARHDQAWLVLDHLGKPEFGSAAAFADWRKHIAEFAAMPHVAVKLSGLVTECGAHSTAADFRPYAESVFELFGSRRVMFGSDWPVCTLTHDYAAVHRFWQEMTAQLSASERAAAETENARRIYRI